MGIREKIADSLQEINGKEADIFRQDASLLMQAILPSGWKWVPCSEDTVVATGEKPYPVYYKEFLPRNSLEGIKALFRGSRCSRALKQTEILRAHHLPTPEILCWGKGGKNEFIFSRGEKGKGFYFFLRDDFSGVMDADKLRRKHRLLKETGKIIGRLHGTGIIHGDMRPNNLLVHEDNDGFHFSFIDIESNKIKRPLGLPAIQKNLVQFFMIPDELLSPMDIVRVYCIYCREFSFFTSREEKISLFRKIFYQRNRRLAHLLKKAYWLKRKKKIEICSGNMRGEYYRQSLLDQFLRKNNDIHAWVTAGKEIKQDNKVTVKVINFEGQKLFTKKYNTADSVFKRLKDKIRHNRVRQLWMISHAFLDLRIPVPHPVGYVSHIKGLPGKYSLFFCEFLQGSRSLRDISKTRKNFPQWLDNHFFLQKFACDLARIHNYGYSHGDPKWANIMINEKTNKHWWVDLDGAKHHHQTYNRCMFKDIARFIVEIVEYRNKHVRSETFLKTYASIRGLSYTFLAKKITPHVNKIIRRHRRQYG